MGILLNVQEKISDLSVAHENQNGKIYKEMTEIKADGKALLVRLEGISSHVTHIEDVVVPKLQKDISTRPNKLVDCLAHTDDIKILKDDVRDIKYNTRFIVWLNANPLRWVAVVLTSAIVFPAFSNMLIVNWRDILTWAGKIL